MDMEVVLQEHDGLINTMAGIALNKVRKPTTYLLEDLQQEGRARIIECIQRWWNPNKGVSLKTFIFDCLMNKYSDIVWKSYKVPEETPENQRLPMHKLISPDPYALCAFHEIVEERLTDLELRYIARFLELPLKTSQIRTVLRKELELTYEEELLVRSEIWRKLGGR